MRGWNFIPALLALFALSGQVSASLGDHLPEFRECVAVGFSNSGVNVALASRYQLPYHERLRRHNLSAIADDWQDCIATNCETNRLSIRT